MRAWRLLLILISLVAGTALGLVYGWVIDPVEYVDTSPGSLRVDYQTDIVLMIADIYAQDLDFPLAVEHLSLLGNTDLGNLMVESLEYAEKMHFSAPDIDKLKQLNGVVLSIMHEDGNQP